MIKLDQEFPTAVDSSEPAKYPHGAFKNSTVQGAYNGTPITGNVMNDSLGFHEALLYKGNVIASGTPEAANSSQLVTAMQNIARVQACEAMTGDYKSGYGIQFFDRPSGSGAASIILSEAGMTIGATEITSLHRMRLECIPGCYYSSIRLRLRNKTVSPNNPGSIVFANPYITRCNANTGPVAALRSSGSIEYSPGGLTTQVTRNIDIALTVFVAEVGDFIEFVDPFGGADSNDFYLLSVVARGVHPPIAGW